MIACKNDYDSIYVNALRSSVYFEIKGKDIILKNGFNLSTVILSLSMSDFFLLGEGIYETNLKNDFDILI